MNSSRRGRGRTQAPSSTHFSSILPPPPLPLPLQGGLMNTPNRTMNPLESIDELLRQCRSYQEINSRQKKRYSYGTEDNSRNNYYQEIMTWNSHLSELIHNSTQQILAALDQSQSQYLHQISILKTSIDEIAASQKKIQDDLNKLFEQHGHHAKISCSEECSKALTDTEQICQHSCENKIPSNEEDFWLSLSSLTCSPPDIALAQLLKPTDELLDAREKASENQSGSTTESPILTKRKYEVHQECFSLPLVSNRGFRTEDDSDSDDYCAWRSRDVEL